MQVKKANVVPIQKKVTNKPEKTIVQCLYFQFVNSKIFERLLYNEMFGFLLDKGLISANQSGSKPEETPALINFY